LTDQDIYYITVEWLISEGHDVVTARELELHRARDEDLLLQSFRMDRRLLTRDKDYGALVFLKRKISAGVILLDINPITVHEVHLELMRLFHEHDEEKLHSSFCVVEPHRHRIRHLR
jgi:predicted nuclease of predicted toxin-antitoxin system